MSESSAQLHSSSVSTRLRLRIMSAAVMIPVSLLFVAAGGWALALLAIALGAAMSWEVSRQIAPRHPLALTTLSAWVIAIAIALGLEGRSLMAAAVLGIGGLALTMLASKLGLRRNAPFAGITLVYVGLAGFSLVALRGGSDAAAWVVAWLFLLVWAADTAGFLVGSWAGRHLLWPAVSPDKTWEGLGAAMAAAAIIGLCLAPKLPAFGLVNAAFLSAGLAVVAQIGDLLESALKRRLGVKDMSGLIPGHGGVLDRLDSLLLVLIIAGIGERVWSF